MPVHNSARKRTKKVIRRPLCSRCGNFGHYAKKCKIQQSVLLKKKMDSNKAKPVGINFLAKSDLSPHVINLGGEKQMRLIEKINAFSELAHKAPQIEVINFADKIKEANLKSSQKVKKIKEEPVKITVKPLLSEDFSTDEEPEAIATIPKLTKLQEISKRQFSWPKFDLKMKNPFASLRSGAQKVKAVKENKNDGNLSFWPKFSWQKMAYATVTASLLLSIPFPAIGYYNKIKETNGILVQESTNGFLALQSSTKAAFQSNLALAESELVRALQSFGAANDLADKEYGAIFSIAKYLPIVGKEVSSRQSLLRAGQHLALGNTYLLKGVDEVGKEKDLNLTTKIEIVKTHLKSALPQYEEALAQLSEVDAKVVPAEYSKNFSDFKVLFAALVGDMKNVVSLTDSANLLLGSNDLKRYLIVFQNNNELRPTGGFMGSFAVVDVQKGKLLNIEVPGGGSYDLKGQFTHFIAPPLPLQMVNGRWEFQDSNWFPDFAASAQKMEWFYENSRGRTVDGVIAVNASVLERVIDVFGSLKSQEKQLELTKSDALVKLQNEVEVNYDKTKNKPKEVIGELLSGAIDNVGQLNSSQLLQLLLTLNDAVNKKEIQIYSNDPGAQNELRKFGWTGEILPTVASQDYLFVVAANLQGQKSDAKINQKITHSVEVLADGSVIDTVKVGRQHTGHPGEMFYGAVNVSYLRFYVPAGSELIEASGFVYPTDEAFHAPENWYEKDADVEQADKELSIDVKTGTRVTTEFGKTVFGNWMVVEPGKKSEVYVKYKLPFKIIGGKIQKEIKEDWSVASVLKEKREYSKYNLVLQKQSGENSAYNFNLNYPVGWLPIWQSNDSMDINKSSVVFDGDLNSDGVYGVLMEKE